MYSQRELTALAAGKTVLRRRITLQRMATARAAARVAQPLEWLDQALARWRQLSPLVKAAALPLGLWLTRARAPRRKLFGTVLRWGPVVLGAFRGLARPRPVQPRG
jgi:hypothetical protein